MLKKRGIGTSSSAVARVGRGYLYLTAAKAYALLTGYLIYLGLARVLGPAPFGIYGVVIGMVSIPNMVLITATIQAVSKFVSERPEGAEGVKGHALRLQAGIGGGLFLAYFLGAPLLAHLLNDPNYTPYIRLSSFIILFYAFYGVFLGYLNGLQRFRGQALFDMAYGTMKTSLVLGLALAGYSVLGAIGGFAAAAGLVLLGTALFVGLPASPERWARGGSLFRFGLAAAALVLVLHGMLNLDLLMLKALSPSSEADRLAGYYTAALALGRVPYFALISVTFVLFPLISRAIFMEDHAAARTYIRRALRFSLFLAAVLSLLIAARAEGWLILLFSDRYAPAGPALQVAAFGLLAFGLFALACSIISASGRPRDAVWMGMFGLGVQMGLAYLWIPRWGAVGAAMASALAMAAALTTSGLYLHRRWPGSLPIDSLPRVALAGPAAYLLTRFAPLEGLSQLAAAAGGAFLFFLLLRLLGGLTGEDWDLLRQMGRRSAGGPKAEGETVYSG